MSNRNKNQNGMVLVICMFLLVTMTAWSFSLCMMANFNLQLSWNHQQSNRAFEAASSGLSITRRWFIDNANGFTGIYHVLNTTKQQGFITVIEEIDPNTLTVTVTGFSGNFAKQVGGDFIHGSGWQFLPATYFEK